MQSKRHFVLRLALGVALAATAFAASSSAALAHGGARHASPPRVPVDQPARGLVYKGLLRATSGPCAGGYRLLFADDCTHGPDPGPEGVDVRARAVSNGVSTTFTESPERQKCSVGASSIELVRLPSCSSSSASGMLSSAGGLETSSV